jgi:SH3-like domain-containing protein
MTAASPAYIQTSSFAYIQTSHALMRQTPEPRATVVSDANHSEQVEILQERGKWVQIRTVLDGYTGWVRARTIAKQPSEFFTGQIICKTTRMQAHIYSEMDTVRGPVKSLGYGCRFKILDTTHERWMKIQLVNGSEAFVQKGDITLDFKPLSFDQIVDFSKKFLNLPYAWGGKSSLKGYDCSGFTQMLYQQMGIFLPRDSKDQFACSQFQNVPMDELEPGDLIFWGKDPDKIRHVGMYIGNQEFIHSTVRGLSPWIQITKLDHPDWNGKSDSLPFIAARRLAKPAPSVAEAKKDT